MRNPALGLKPDAPKPRMIVHFAVGSQMARRVVVYRRCFVVNATTEGTEERNRSAWQLHTLDLRSIIDVYQYCCTLEAAERKEQHMQCDRLQ